MWSGPALRLRSRPIPPFANAICRSERALWEMLGVPIGFQVRIDFGVDQENAGRAFIDPTPHRLEIGKGSNCCRACTISSGDRGKIRFRELHDVDRITLAPKEMHFGSIGAVVVDEDAHSQPETHCSFKISDRHQKPAVARTEHRELAGICYGKTNRGCQAKAD